MSLSARSASHPTLLYHQANPILGYSEGESRARFVQATL